MAHRDLLCNLNDGDGFMIPDPYGCKGVKISGNDCECKVRYLQAGKVSVSGWAPMTEVIRCSVDLTLLAAAEVREEMVCTCGKACTSKSGLTLHQLRCVQHQQAG